MKRPARLPRMTGRTISRYLAIFIVGGLQCCLASEAIAESIPLADMHALILRKILAYDKKLSSPTVGILYSKETKSEAEELAQALNKLELATSTYSADTFSENAKKFSVAVLLVAAVPASTKEVAAKEHILTVSTSFALAEKGDVSISVGINSSKKPEIIIHLGRLTAEGHELAPAVLASSKVIK